MSRTALSLVWLAGWACLTGCGTFLGGANGDWFETGVHPSYPAPRFMVGVGYGDSMKDADDMARGELSKSFKAKVTSVSLETDSYHQTDRTTGSEAIREFKTRTFTRVKGQAVLEDVRIAERRLVGDRHYALAVVDASALRGKWGKKAASLEHAMEVSLASGSDSGPARIQGIAGALRRLGEKRALEAQVRAIGGSTPADTRDYDALFVEMQALLHKHHPIVLETDDATLKRMAGEALSSAWLVVADAQPGVDSVVTRITLTLEVRKVEDGFDILYTAGIEATQNGRLLAQRRVADRLIHKVEEMGKQMVYLVMRDRLLKPFAADLANVLLGSPALSEKTK